MEIGLILFSSAFEIGLKQLLARKICNYVDQIGKITTCSIVYSQCYPLVRTADTLVVSITALNYFPNFVRDPISPIFSTKLCSSERDTHASGIQN